MKNDIRSFQHRIKIKPDECLSDAIADYMKRNGFRVEKRTNRWGLPETTFHNKNYGRLWIGNHQVGGENDDIAIFQIAGDK